MMDFDAQKLLGSFNPYDKFESTNEGKYKKCPKTTNQLGFGPKMVDYYHHGCPKG